MKHGRKAFSGTDDSAGNSARQVELRIEAALSLSEATPIGVGKKIGGGGFDAPR